MRKFISGKAVLEKGHAYSIDSHLGGSFTVIYQGVKNGKHRFKNTSHDYSKMWPHFDVDEADLTSTIFVVLPESPTFRKWHDEDKVKAGVHLEHEYYCKACRSKTPATEG